MRTYLSTRWLLRCAHSTKESPKAQPQSHSNMIVAPISHLKEQAHSQMDCSTAGHSWAKMEMGLVNYIQSWKRVDQLTIIMALTSKYKVTLSMLTRWLRRPMSVDAHSAQANSEMQWGMVLENSGWQVLAHLQASFNATECTRESCANSRKITLPSSSPMLNTIGNKI